MGAGESKTVAEVVNQVSAEVIMRNMSSCTGQSDQYMNISNSGFSLFSSFSQKSSINLSCMANFNVDNNVITQISNAIQQEAQKQGVALLDILNFDSASAEAHIKSTVSSKITNEVVQETVAKINQIMIAQNAGVMIGGSYSQDADTVVRALQDSISKTGLGTEIENSTSQKAIAKKTNPLDFIFSYFSYIIFAVIFIIVVIVAAIFLI